MNNIIIQALKSIKTNTSRTVLTTVGILIGIMSVTLIMSAGKGLENFVISELASFGDNWINIEVKVPASTSALGMQVTTLKSQDAKSIFALESIQYGYYGVLGQHIISYENKVKRLNSLATSEGYITIDNSEINTGRFFTKEENDTAAKVVILGPDVKDRFFPGRSAIGKFLRVDNKSFRVIGVFKERGSINPFFDYDNLIYVPIKTEQKILQGIDHVSYIIAQVVNADKINDTADEIKALMRDRHDIVDIEKEDFRVTTVQETMDIINKILLGIQILLLAVSAISLVVGGVGIMNVMYVSVSERTFEIGLRKAVGAKQNAILLQFLLEAVIITLLGGILGILFSFGGAKIANLILEQNNINLIIAITPLGVGVATIFSVTIGLVFGIYPAKKASSLNPIEALHKE